MSYSSDGRRPIERASKSAHHHIINDRDVVRLVEQSWMPPPRENVSLPAGLEVPDLRPDDSINHFIAVDGSYQETVVRPQYPSSRLAFFQFGALVFSKQDLMRVGNTPHPSPEDMQKLRNLERLKFAMPMSNMRLGDASSLVESVRLSFYRFLCDCQVSGSPLIESLEWLVFQEFLRIPGEDRLWNLASNPCTVDGEHVTLKQNEMRPDYTFQCQKTNRTIYLSDVFRLHERVDEDLGAGGVLGVLTTAIEQLLVVHILRLVAAQRPSALSEIAIIKDGPLAFFGVTANLHKPMRLLLNHISNRATPTLVGIEKSGPFVEHAKEISSRMLPGQALILNDEYIYRNILAGRSSEAESRSYGASTYFGRKVLFKTKSGSVHVVTIPTKTETDSPRLEDFHSFQTGLQMVELLHCDMYDNALFPIALANKLVSLSAHPSQRILERFATHSVGSTPG